MFQEILEYIESAEEKEKYFEERTRKHINLVQKAAQKIVDAYPEYKELLSKVKVHDQSKFEEPERTPYIDLTWDTYLKNKGSYKTPGTLDDEEKNKATLHHITTNEHHPEYWLDNKEDANIDPKDRDKSVKVVDASRMPPIAIAEMVADWQAMSEELKNNTARVWFEKQKGVRWNFSPEQEELISKLLAIFEGKEDEFISR